MTEPSVRPADEIEETILKYSNTLFRVCFVILRNRQDTEDALQETFLRYVQKHPDLSGEAHEKAWLITVAANVSRDILKRSANRRHFSLDELDESYETPEDGALMGALLALPEKNRTILFLHYVEGYRVDEIAAMNSLTPSAVKMRLSKGRRLLQARLKEDGTWTK